MLYLDQICEVMSKSHTDCIIFVFDHANKKMPILRITNYRHFFLYKKLLCGLIPLRGKIRINLTVVLASQLHDLIHFVRSQFKIKNIEIGLDMVGI
mgnify:CR=1 FL=1